VAGMSYEEAAEVMKVAVGTVKSRVARGRQALEIAMYGTPVSSPAASLPVTSMQHPSATS